MKPSEYLDAVRIKKGLPSDYALQKPLGLSTSQLSKYRKNLDYFSDEICYRVAEILGKEPGLVVLDMHREKAKTPEIRVMWDSIFAGFPALSLLAKSGWRFALPR